MAERDSYANGTPSWVDVSSRDIDASAAFYTAVFGWTAESTGSVEETGGYTMLNLRGRPVAGLGPHQDPTSEPAWTTYIAVDDCDKTAAAAKAGGATVAVEPFDVMTAGRMAFLLDPQGAFFGLWQSGEHHGAGIVNEPGSLVWNELMATDVDAAFKFYGGVFGWSPQSFETGNPDAPYALLMLGEEGVGGATTVAVGGVDRPQWVTTFAVADCDATADLVSKNGGTVVNPPSDGAVGRSARCLDPQGAMFQIMALAEPAAG